MAMTGSAVAQAAKAAAASLRDAEQELNAADALLGDGDTGVTMRRVFEKVADAANDSLSDLGATFRAMGMAATGATGSSLGTLVAVAFLEVAGQLRGREAIEGAKLPKLLRSAQAKMLARGGAALGEKTVHDSLDAVAAALEGSPEADPSAAAVDAARSALASFRERPCRIGRRACSASAASASTIPGCWPLPAWSKECFHVSRDAMRAGEG
jgi:dihydroxyacetone kinase